MSEPDLEALERRWRETGSPEDEARYLQERVEQEDLDRSGLRLAAYAGKLAAGIALGQEAPASQPDLREWVLGLEEWGDEVCIMAAAVCARLLLELPEPPPGAPSVTALDAVETWISCPCPKHDKGARVAWTRDAPWAYEVEWAELAAEVAWTAHWVTSEEAVRTAIGQWLVAKGLQASSEAD